MPDRDLADSAAGGSRKPPRDRWRYLALPQQVTGGAVICGGIAKSIGHDQGARDGRQHFGRLAWREPFRNELVQAHLEKALHLRRNGRRQILRGGAEHGARAHAPFGQSRAAEGVRPHADRVRILLEFLVDEFRSLFGPAANDGRRERLFGREMVVNARALDADIRRDLAKAKAAETAELHAPLGGIHDRSFNVLHAGLSINYLVIDSRCAGKRQLLSIYLS